MTAASSACGVLLVAKPAGLTSHDVVQQVRHGSIAGGAKAGHAGTLDPFATGLLLVLVGRATRLAQYLVGLPKSYRTVAQFGARSDSGDRDGTITQTGKTTDRQAIEAELASLRGTITQAAPMVSAIKVDGERLYEKARRGEQIETPVRELEISRFDLDDFDAPSQRATFEIDCSSGTYVRQLVTDLGDRCGCGAYCDELERTAVGAFTLDQADPERLLDPAEVLSFMPERSLSSQEAALVKNGVAVAANGSSPEQKLVRLTDAGKLVAVAQRRGEELKPVTVMAAN